MIFQVIPETHALLCLLIMAVAFIAAMVIADMPPPAVKGHRLHRARRTHHRRRTHLRVIHPQKAVKI